MTKNLFCILTAIVLCTACPVGIYLDNESYIVYADDEEKDKDKSAKGGKPEDKGEHKQEAIQYKHDCETNQNRQTPTSLAGGGALRYDIDCAPFHQDGILDLTGKHSWSIVGWIQRLLTFGYRLAFGFAVAALLWASVIPFSFFFLFYFSFLPDIHVGTGSRKGRYFDFIF